MKNTDTDPDDINDTWKDSILAEDKVRVKSKFCCKFPFIRPIELAV